MDAVFCLRESIPGQYLEILGYDNRAVVVLCKGRVLARKQIQISNPSGRSAGLQEVKPSRRLGSVLMLSK